MVNLALCMAFAIGANWMRAQAESVVFNMAPSQWNQKVFPVGSHTSEESCVMASGTDPAPVGPWLSVGPWYSGQYTSRYEYKTAMTSIDGTLHGRVRTENLPGGYAVAHFRYRFADGSRLDRKMCFGLSTEWTEFDLPVRYLASGTPTDVLVSLGLDSQTFGSVQFANVEWRPLPSSPFFPENAGPLTRAQPVAGATGSRYRIASQSGTAWLIAPDGEPFYARSVDSPQMHSVEEGRQIIATARAAGFNSFGGWISNLYWLSRTNDALVAEGSVPMPVFAALGFPNAPASLDMMTHWSEGSGATGHEFPDVYDPDFETAFRGMVQDDLDGGLAGKSWFVGWFTGNEMDIENLHRRIHSPACWAAYMVFLQTRYANQIAQLNAAWGASHVDFAEITQEDADTTIRQGARYEDLMAFKRQTLQLFYQTTTTIIRELDPGRLVFSQRFNGFSHFPWSEPDLLQASYDAVGVNIYPENTQGGLLEGEIAYLTGVAAATGLPVIIGEWSVPASDSGYYDGTYPLDFSWPNLVMDQEERARQAMRVQAEFYNLPFIIGADWFKWKDYEGPSRWANRGLFRADAITPWQGLQDALGDIGRIIDLVESGAPVGNYERWAGGLAAAADTDGDRMSNLLEYAMGTDPVAGDLASGRMVFTGSTPGQVDGRVEFRNDRPDLLHAIEYSDDLATWQAFAGDLVRTTVDPVWTRLDYHDTTSTGGKRFYRLKVVLEAR